MAHEYTKTRSLRIYCGMDEIEFSEIDQQGEIKITIDDLSVWVEKGDIQTIINHLQKQLK